MLHDAWYGGKNKTQPPIDLHLTGNDDGSGYVIADVPLTLVRPNEAGDRYDGTADLERVRYYATQCIETPVHLLFSPRGVRRGMTHANVMDGGHRVSARRLQGHESIPALMQKSDFDLLLVFANALVASDNLENQGLIDRSARALAVVQEAINSRQPKP